MRLLPWNQQNKSKTPNPPIRQRKGKKNNMQNQTRHKQGHLYDLATDGLGYIIPIGKPNKKLAFTTRCLNSKSFQEAGLQEGDLVEYEINEKQQINKVVLVSASS